MSLRRETPCDFGPCPYDSETNDCCEYWCGADEPEDNPLEWEFGCLIPFPEETEPDESLPGWAPEYWDDVVEGPFTDESTEEDDESEYFVCVSCKLPDIGIKSQ